ncbi:MAG: aldehyde dehydrogenase family protein [Chthoniobacter sp.]
MSRRVTANAWRRTFRRVYSRSCQAAVARAKPCAWTHGCGRFASPAQSPVGRALAEKLAADFSKDLALELGGSNALIVCADADLDKAAQAAADGACLTAGQRCNATSRVIVERTVAADFLPRLVARFANI